MIDPAGCIELGCSYLYSYEDQITGGRFMGCMQRVFGAEIDMDAFDLAEATSQAGFGGIKMTGTSLPHCQFNVEQAYEGDGPAFECVNRTFFDCAHDGPDGVQAFDLRNALQPPR